MENASKCCLCGNGVDSETANILAMGRIGTPRYLCENCSARIESATTSRDYTEAAAAIEELGRLLVVAGELDGIVEDTLTPMLNSAAERAAKIKSGEYDFSLDERERPDDMEEIPEELLETEEDRILDERDAEAQSRLDKYMNIGMIAAVTAAAVIFLILKLSGVI